MDWEPVYDANGQLIEDWQWDYTWDAAGNLRQMVSSDYYNDALEVSPVHNYDSITLNFDYDYQGRRIQKSVTYDGASTPTTEVLYVWDGWHLLAELDAQNNNALIRAYAWGLDLSHSMGGAGGTRGLIAVYDAESDETWLPQYDGRGNVVGIVDAATGEVIDEYEYAPFGKMVREPNTVAGQKNPFRFSTRYYDKETGLYYYGYRYYNPETEHWLSREPLGEGASANLYAFADNDPLNNIDVLGLAPFPHGSPDYSDPRSVMSHANFHAHMSLQSDPDTGYENAAAGALAGALLPGPSADTFGIISDPSSLEYQVAYGIRRGRDIEIICNLVSQDGGKPPLVEINPFVYHNADASTIERCKLVVLDEVSPYRIATAGTVIEAKPHYRNFHFDMNRIIWREKYADVTEELPLHIVEGLVRLSSDNRIQVSKEDGVVMATVTNNGTRWLIGYDNGVYEQPAVVLAQRNGQQWIIDEQSDSHTTIVNTINGR